MDDRIPAPKVKTVVRQGDFELVILAYRSITREEAFRVAAEWLKAHKRKTFPKSGKATIETMIGFGS